MSKTMTRAGWAIGGLPALFILTSGVNLMLIKSPDMVAQFANFGFPPHLITPIGVVELLCAVLYLIPRTAVIGAVLLTAYMGGAVATHVRIEDPMFVVPVVIGVMLWLGLYLRDATLRTLVPLRKD
jgi:DoxX-like family